MIILPKIQENNLVTKPPTSNGIFVPFSSIISVAIKPLTKLRIVEISTCSLVASPSFDFPLRELLYLLQGGTPVRQLRYITNKNHSDIRVTNAPTQPSWRHNHMFLLVTTDSQSHRVTALGILRCEVPSWSGRSLPVAGFDDVFLPCQGKPWTCESGNAPISEADIHSRYAPCMAYFPTLCYKHHPVMQLNIPYMKHMCRNNG